MKLLTTILTLTSTLAVFSQVVKLDIQNPAPRVGEEIVISVIIKKQDIPQEFPISLNKFKTLSDNKIGHGEIKFTLSESDTGTVIFGPFNFMVDGKEYTSDTLAIRVYPKLPPEKQGIWIRQIHFNGKHLLIVEQRIPNEWKKNNRDDRTFNNEGLQFAEIDEELIDHDGFKINNYYSTSTSQIVEEGKMFEGGMVSYRMAIYNIKLPDDYNGKFKLKKKHFKNFPKGMDLEEIIIK